MQLSVVHQQSAVAPDCLAAAVFDPQPLLILKFGSSVLRSIDDLPAVAGELYRQRRSGNRVIAVVSAFAGETDRLFAEAAAASMGTTCSGTADLVSLGEERTAALLRIACDRIGLPAAICRAEELGLHTQGDELDADFAELLPFALARKLDREGLVIVPGFVGLSQTGARTLLGRGGSDLTAVILSGELGAGIIRLYKDVDGVFERDPAVDPGARKLETLSYEKALRIAQTLVHSKAVTFAAARALPIEVGTIGGSRPTRIGITCESAVQSSKTHPVRVALAGYGVVGQAVARRLALDPRFTIAAILVRNLDRERAFPPPVPLTNDPEAFGKVEADILIELLSCDETGAALCCAKLEAGTPVVTASKRVVSERLGDLRASSVVGGTAFAYSAAVGGSAPVLEAIDREARDGELVAVRGVLNGTVNYVLERLAEGMDLETALDLARAAGFAEANSEADLSGADAASKLKLIAHRAFGVQPSDVEVTCDRLDTRLAERLTASRERWVQFAEVRRTEGRLHARVRLCAADACGLSSAPDEWNVCVIEHRDGKQTTLHGRGAGGAATAEAVLADVYDAIAQ